jgi:hypothetical protein
LHGVPADLDLSPLVGSYLFSITLTAYQIQLHFSYSSIERSRTEQDWQIACEGGWELLDARGEVLDEQQDPRDREQYRVPRLLNRTVLAVRVEAPRSFEITFEGGLTLRLIDDSEQFETIRIWPAGIVI